MKNYENDTVSAIFRQFDSFSGSLFYLFINLVQIKFYTFRQCMYIVYIYIQHTVIPLLCIFTKNLSSQCDLIAQIEPVQDKI
jgi:hypothetical protein